MGNIDWPKPTAYIRLWIHYISGWKLEFEYIGEICIRCCFWTLSTEWLGLLCNSLFGGLHVYRFNLLCVHIFPSGPRRYVRVLFRAAYYWREYPVYIRCLYNRVFIQLFIVVVMQMYCWNTITLSVMCVGINGRIMHHVKLQSTVLNHVVSASKSVQGLFNFHNSHSCDNSVLLLVSVVVT